jgi:hypothetical protein
VLWSIIIAFQYAKLWSEGYDWRDVFRQPRDRELMEVVEEFFEYVRAHVQSRSRARGCGSSAPSAARWRGRVRRCCRRGWTRRRRRATPPHR